MKTVRTFVSKTKDRYSIEFPAPGAINSFFVFSMVKSGSTLQNSVVSDLCTINNVPTVSIHDQAFLQGVATKDIQSDIEDIIFQKGYGYLGFRHYLNPKINVNINRLAKILLVRKPLDILTSLYFSVKYSHFIPANGRSRSMMLQRQKAANSSDINHFALNNAESIRLGYMSYLKVLDNPNWHVFKYEEVISKKRSWIKELSTILSLPISEGDLDLITNTHDIFPREERTSEHIRQVWPDNHKKHLDNKTIALLNKKFAEVNEYFGYY